MPASIHPSHLEERAVVWATPGRLRSTVETALPHHLPLGIGTALVVAAVGSHGHGPILTAGRFPLRSAAQNADANWERTTPKNSLQWRSDVPPPDTQLAPTPAHDEGFRADALVEGLPDALLVIDEMGTVTFANAAAQVLVGRSIRNLIGTNAIELIDPDEHGLAVEALGNAAARGPGLQLPVTLRVPTPAGERRVVELLGNNQLDDPSVRGMIIVARDVTDRAVQHVRAQAERQRFEVAFEHSPIGRALASLDGRLVRVNRSFCELTGFPAEALVGMKADALLVEANAADRGMELTLLLEGRVDHAVIERDLRRFDATLRRVRATVALVPNAAGEPEWVDVSVEDVTELREAQEQLAHQATHDPLTRLSNRAFFQELGEQALARAHRDGTLVAVLFLDLDRFKRVNDTWGHAAGDELLREVAGRLRTCVRRSDVLSRFGGDEFIVLCEHPAGRPEMLDLAGRLIAAVSEPITLGSVTTRVGVSVGIAIGAGDRVTIDSLLRDADAALYEAKDQGRGRAELFGATSLV